MEHVIGYLGSLLRQPSNPFCNLAAQAKHVINTNALVAMWPDFEQAKDNPQGLKDLGNGYLLLGPKDTSPYHLLPAKQTAVDTFFFGYPGIEGTNQQAIYQWGCLKMPVNQIARSQWKEVERCSDMARTDRNLKVRGLI